MAKNEFSLVFDIETAPDAELIKQTLFAKEDISPAEALAKHREYLKENKKSPFLKLEFHKIVSLCCLVQNDYTEDDLQLKVFSAGQGQNEAAIIEGFYKEVTAGGKFGRIIGYNSKGFDLPVLTFRALKHGIPLPMFFESGDNHAAFRYGQTYINRYNHKFHLDLMDRLALFRVSSATSLHNMCEMCGIPGKLDCDGSAVEDLANSKQFDKIDAYCQNDVISTALLYYYYQVLAGEVEVPEGDEKVEDLIEFLSSQGNRFEKFLTEYDLRNKSNE